MYTKNCILVDTWQFYVPEVVIGWAQQEVFSRLVNNAVRERSHYASTRSLRIWLTRTLLLHIQKHYGFCNNTLMTSKIRWFFHFLCSVNVTCFSSALNGILICSFLRDLELQFNNIVNFVIIKINFERACFSWKLRLINKYL